MTSDTPKTDAAAYKTVVTCGDITATREEVTAEFARTLERALAATSANAEGVIWELHIVEGQLAAALKAKEEAERNAEAWRLFQAVENRNPK